MAGTTMPDQVARQLGQPRGATRSKGLVIFGMVVFVIGIVLVMGYLVFRGQPKGVQEAIVTYATKTLASPTQDGYSQQAKVETKGTPPPVDTSAADERQRILQELLALRQKIDALEKRKTTSSAAAAPKPEKRPAPMLYLNKDIEDKVAALPDASPPLYTLAAWATYLPCVIQPLMNSDVPGTFTAKITANVRDTRTGQHILVPQNATIGGQDVGEALLYGNQRLPTYAMALTIEDRTYELGQVPVTDQLGTNGLTGDVDNHWARLAGAVIITGVLAGGQQALQTGIAQAGGAGQVATGITSAANQVGQQRAGRALDTRPTIRVFPGQVCQVLLTKPLALPALWNGVAVPPTVAAGPTRRK